MIDNFIDMIAGSLNLREPWYVMDAEFCAERQEVHIFVGVWDMKCMNVSGGMETVCSILLSSTVNGAPCTVPTLRCQTNQRTV